MLEPMPNYQKYNSISNTNTKPKTLRHSIESKRSLESIYDQCCQEKDTSKYERAKLQKKIDKTITNVNKDAKCMSVVFDKYVG